MFSFDNLDSETRELMAKELSFDISRGSVFMSHRLLEGREQLHVSLLEQALLQGTPESFAQAIKNSSLLKTIELRTKNGRQFPANVPYTAHETLADGEFNRFYVRALCLRAIHEGKNEIEVYRAKPVRASRVQSEALIGTFISCAQLLEDLRNNIGVDTALGVPAGPNSGLSVRLKTN